MYAVIVIILAFCGIGNETYLIHLNIRGATYYSGVIKVTALYFSPGTSLMIIGKYYLVLFLHNLKLIQSVV